MVGKILAVLFGLLAASIVVLIVVLVGKLSPGYEVTNGSVYFRQFNNLNWKTERREVVGANADSFQGMRSSGGKYGSDDKHVYFENTLITNGDPQTFRVLDWRNELSRDAQRVYWKSIELSDDPEHFEILDGGYSRDAHHVYYASHIVEGADPDSFVVTAAATSAAKDKDHQYEMGRLK